MLLYECVVGFLEDRIVDSECFYNLIGDIENFVLVIFGFSITLFTVLYSFIYTKRDIVIEVDEKIKQKKDDLFSIRERSNAILIIIKFKSMNRHLSILTCLSFFTYLVSIFIKYYNMIFSFSLGCVCFLMILAIIIVIYVMIILVITHKDYTILTKI